MRRPPCTSKPYLLTLSSATALTTWRSKSQVSGFRARARRTGAASSAAIRRPVCTVTFIMPDAPRWWRSAVAASKWSAMTTTWRRGHRSGHADGALEFKEA